MKWHKTLGDLRATKSPPSMGWRFVRAGLAATILGGTQCVTVFMLLGEAEIWRFGASLASIASAVALVSFCGLGTYLAWQVSRSTRLAPGARGFLALVLLLAFAAMFIGSASSALFHRFELASAQAAKLLIVIRKDSRFDRVKLQAYTKHGGSLLVMGHVATEDDLKVLRSILEELREDDIPIHWDIQPPTP